MQSLDDRACALQQQVNELEALVAVACCRGVEPGRCRDVVQDAVRRARRKGAMLAHFDSALLLSSLEQAKSEIAGIADVTATNAEVMADELLHHQERTEEWAAAGSEDLAAASVVSQRGSRAPSLAAAASTAAESAASGSPTAAAQGEERSAHGGEMLSGAAGASGSGGPLAPHTPHSVHSVSSSLSVADAVAPMRDFASEVAAEVAAEAEEQRSFRRLLTMKASKSGDFRKAASYDFGTAQSPRASYHVRDDPFQQRLGLPQEREFTLGRSRMDDAAIMGGGWRPPAGGGALPPPGAAHPAERRGGLEGEEDEEDEAPLLVYSRTPGASSAALESESREEEEEEEEEAEEEGAEEAEGDEEAEGAEEPGPRGFSEVSASPWAGRRHSAGSEGRCWTGAPPGLSPLAAVEGSTYYGEEALEDRQLSIDPSSPTGMGDVDLVSYSSAPFSLHSVTPPRHVMRELAAEMQGRLRL